MAYRFMKPLEMPRGTHYGNNYWIFYSVKLGRRVTAFSNLEYENLITLEMNPEVEYYCEQPTKIILFDKDEDKTAIPDVWVLYRDGREEFQEVKYAESLLEGNPDYMRSMEQIEREKSWCEMNGFDFSIKTYESVHIGEYYLRNLIFLRGHLKSNLLSNNSTFRKLFNAIKYDSTIGSLINDETITEKNMMTMLSSMFYKGLITFDDFDDKPLRLETRVRLNEENI